MVSRILLAAAALTAVAACSAASPAPKGWQPMPGASAAWSTGAGPTQQQYRFTKTTFTGSLQELASRVAIDALIQNRGARMVSSLPFPACPGAGAVATFMLPTRWMLQEAFAVHDGAAVRISYLRPPGTPVDPSVSDAMQRALCTL